jgi:phosphoglycerol transferase MdoB-like AlkP superfamily enzyme
MFFKAKVNHFYFILHCISLFVIILSLFQFAHLLIASIVTVLFIIAQAFQYRRYGYEIIAEDFYFRGFLYTKKIPIQTMRAIILKPSGGSNEYLSHDLIGILDVDYNTWNISPLEKEKLIEALLAINPAIRIKKDSYDLS